MAKKRHPADEVNSFILSNLAASTTDIAGKTAARFGISRQAVNYHLRKLVHEGLVSETGKTRNKKFSLTEHEVFDKSYALSQAVGESTLWTIDVAPILQQLPDNVRTIWQYGFTEMFNNVIDHSEAIMSNVHISTTALSTKMTIHDNGVGIFRKIQAALKLTDERHAALELAKGKFTTDPTRHSGEGIFFTSRVFDHFRIYSSDVFYSHTFNEYDWIIDIEKSAYGTTVQLEIDNHSTRTLDEVFQNFTSGDGFAFNKTIVPVNLLKYGDDNLISRSQAKRLLSRFDQFEIILLDFKNVDSVGQAFADEIFRVFVLANPTVTISAVNANEQIENMISRAKHT